MINSRRARPPINHPGRGSHTHRPLRMQTLLVNAARRARARVTQHFCLHAPFLPLSPAHAGPPGPDHRAPRPADRVAGSVHLYERHLGRRHSGGHRIDYFQHMESTSPVSWNTRQIAGTPAITHKASTGLCSSYFISAGAVRCGARAAHSRPVHTCDARALARSLRTTPARSRAFRRKCAQNPSSKNRVLVNHGTGSVNKIRCGNPLQLQLMVRCVCDTTRHRPQLCAAAGARERMTLANHRSAGDHTTALSCGLRELMGAPERYLHRSIDV